MKRKNTEKKRGNNFFGYYLYKFYYSHFFQDHKKLIIYAFIWGIISFLSVIIAGICTSINPIQPTTLKNNYYHFNFNSISLSVNLSWIFFGISLFFGILIHFYQKHQEGKRFTFYPKEFYYPLLTWLGITLFFHVFSLIISYFGFYYPFLLPLPKVKNN